MSAAPAPIHRDPTPSDVEHAVEEVEAAQRSARVRSSLNESMRAVRKRLGEISGDTGRIQLDKKKTKQAVECYQEESPHAKER